MISNENIIELKKIQIKILKLNSNAVIPKYATIGAAGFDLAALNNVVIKPNDRITIPTGLSIELPLGYELQIRSRSGITLRHGIIVPNSPGTIDSDYRGEIKVILTNISTIDYLITAGDRIAQAVIAETIQADFTMVDEINLTKRNSGGFGSTGK